MQLGLFSEALNKECQTLYLNPSKYSPPCDRQSFSLLTQFIIFSRYTVQTLKNSRTEIFAHLIFSSSDVFFFFFFLSLESQGARSGEYGGCGSSTTFSCFIYSRTMAALCDEAISCNNLTPWRQVAGRRLKKYFFNL